MRRPFLLVVVLIAAGALLFLHAQRPPDPSRYLVNGQVSFLPLEKYWEGRIRNVGASAAYQEMFALASPLPVSQGHSLSHTFGAALYRVSGLTDISVCSREDALLWGCFHEAVGEALAKQGLGILNQLATDCTQNPVGELGCEHGLGHGLVGYFGYSIDNLKTALADCDRIDPGNLHSGCTEGAVMEYNLREQAATTTIADPRPFSPTTAYSPCTDLPDHYAFGCGFELPYWWIATHPSTRTTTDQFSWMHASCAQSPEDSMRDGCMEGLGFLAGMIEGFPAGLPACGTSPEVHCAVGLVRAALRTSTSSPAVLCRTSGLSGSDLKYCTQFGATESGELDDVAFPGN